MDSHSKRSRHNKNSKQSRKPHSALRPIISGEISSQFQNSEGSSARRSGSGNSDRLNDIIDDITSEGDDARAIPLSKDQKRSTSTLVEPISPPVNDNHSSLFTLPTVPSSWRDRPKKGSGRDKKLGNFGNSKSFSPIRTNTFDDRSDSTSRRRSIGEVRRNQLTECMEYYRHCLESAQHLNPISMNGDPTNNEKRKQYSTTLW